MQNDLEKLARLVRYYSLVSTTQAGSGHPTSSLSAADLMVGLMFGPSRQNGEAEADTSRPDRAEAGGYFKADLDNPENPNNDRLIFSKGHASPLFYALYAVAGQHHPHPGSSPGPALSSPLKGEGEKANTGEGELKRALNPDELMSLRKFGSQLEGHPTLEFKYTEVPTGSLGQGLCVGLGMALSAKLDKLDYRTFVLLGDSEMAEGSVWEAMAVASHYNLNNLIAILDCNRLGQRGETMLGHHTEIYQQRAEAFGWETITINGHDMGEIASAFAKATADNVLKPIMIIARTLKGKGVSFLEDKDGWHGKALSKEELSKALEELGEVDKNVVGKVAYPQAASNKQSAVSANTLAASLKLTAYDLQKPVATRKAYGNALVNIFESYPGAVVLDAETSNSTFAESVKKTHPERFFEMFIAEQNMVGAALGLSRRGKIPFVSTFAAFFSRAFDQIRMSQYSKANIKFVGSHAGVSIGEDGASQMALEDIAMFRTMFDGVVLYPSDAVSAERLFWLAAEHKGNVYIRTTRKETKLIYDLKNDDFRIGGSKTVKSSATDKATVVAAGITLHEALAAYEELQKENINIRVIDLYSIKPLDVENLQKAARETGVIITVEDHFKEGGLGEAVAAALCTYEVHHILESLAVSKLPKSGKPDELLAYEEINRDAIIRAVRKTVALLNTD